MSPDKKFAFAHLPARQRPAVEALFGIDAAMGDVLRTTSEPMLGQIRLAWWRERLEELDTGAQAPPEPRLIAAERHLVARGIKGSDLARLERGWVALFDPFPWDVGTAEAIWFRGRLVFAIGAQLLGRTDDAIEAAGGIWALGDVALNCSDTASRKMLLDQVTTFSRSLAGTRFAAPLRPLSMLAVHALSRSGSSAAVGIEPSAREAFGMLMHRVTGRFPNCS